jgi:hypothetical protein
MTDQIDTQPANILQAVNRFLEDDGSFDHMEFYAFLRPHLGDTSRLIEVADGGFYGYVVYDRCGSAWVIPARNKISADRVDEMIESGPAARDSTFTHC